MTTEFMDTSTHTFYNPKAENKDVALQFPLFVGKSWTFENTYNPQASFKVFNKQTARVEGWETVTVPAGTFRALKIQHNGWFHTYWGSTGDSWVGTITTTYWYVPEVKRAVRMDYRDTGYSGGSLGGTWDTFRDELIDYRVIQIK